MIVANHVAVFSINEIVSALIGWGEVYCQDVSSRRKPGKMTTASAGFKRADAWDKPARIHQAREGDEVEGNTYITRWIVGQGGIGRRYQGRSAHHVRSNVVCEQQIVSKTLKCLARQPHDRTCAHLVSRAHQHPKTLNSVYKGRMTHLLVELRITRLVF